MGWLEDLKKKAQEGAQTVQNVYNQAKDTATNVASAVQNTYNTAKNTVNNVIGAGSAAVNGASNAVKEHYNEGTNKTQPDVNWAEEYDKVMSGGTTTVPSTSTAPTTSTSDGSTTTGGNQSSTGTTTQWQAELDNIMNQIMNREKFSYDMNGDAMYQQYADMYQNNANLGMQNAMAQAAALTGGYGSSYGQMVGQQAYAQQMQGLNDVALDLYDRAYNQYLNEGDQLAQQYAMIADREQQAYNRDYQANRDAIADQQWADEFQWMQDQHESLYGENGFYATESDKDRTHQKGMQDDAQEHESLESDKDRTHQKGMQDDAQDHESSEADKDRTHQKGMQDDAQEHESSEADKDRTFTAEENKKARDWQTSENATEYEKMYGDFERNADGSLKLDADGNPIGGGYYTRQAWQEHQYDEEEWQRMYGAIEYDDDGNIIGGGYYTILAATEREWAEEDWNKMYADFDRDADGNIIYDENGNPQGGGYYTRQAWQERKYDEEDWNKMYGEDGYYTKQDKEAKEASNPYTTYEGDGMLNGQEVPKQLAGVQGLTTTNTSYFDDNGTLKVAAIVKGSEYDEDGNAKEPEAGVGTMTYNIGGKEITLKTGTNPYTNTVNPDTKNGVFENGYQPDNVEGNKLTETIEVVTINGRDMPVYRTSNYEEYVWDDVNNTYIDITPLRGAAAPEVGSAKPGNPNFVPTIGT